MRIRGERERQEEHERENILERRTRHESSRGRARLDRDIISLFTRSRENEREDEKHDRKKV